MSFLNVSGCVRTKSIRFKLVEENRLLKLMSVSHREVVGGKKTLYILLNMHALLKK